MNSKHDIHNYVIEYISRDMPATVIHTWFSDSYCVDISDDTFVLFTTSDFKRKVIHERYGKIIREALLELFGVPMILEVVLDGSVESKNVVPTVIGNDRSDYVFDRFVVGNSNMFAFNASVAVAERPGIAYNPLFIYGASGLGKTHLLYAIQNYVKDHHPHLVCRDVTAEQFTNDLTIAIRHSTQLEFREKYRTVDVLLLDDIQFIGGKDYSQDEVYSTFNALYENKKQIVITSDRPPKELPKLEERLRTRFEWGLIIDVSSPDLETRMAIVQSKALRLGMNLKDDVILYIAQSITGNVRLLEGTVKKLLAYRDLMSGGLTVDDVRKAIGDIHPYVKPTPTVILEEVCSFYNADLEDLLGKNKQNSIAKPRQVAMWLIRKLTEMSLEDIGENVFSRDHTTIMYGVSKIEEELKTSTSLNSDIEAIKRNIRDK